MRKYNKKGFTYFSDAQRRLTLQNVKKPKQFSGFVNEARCAGKRLHNVFLTFFKAVWDFSHWVVQDLWALAGHAAPPWPQRWHLNLTGRTENSIQDNNNNVNCLTSPFVPPTRACWWVAVQFVEQRAVERWRFHTAVKWNRSNYWVWAEGILSGCGRGKGAHSLPLLPLRTGSGLSSTGD